MTALAWKSYAPDYRLHLDGRPIPWNLRSVITRISQESGLDGADRVEFTLADVQNTWLDSPLLALDQRLELDMGYAPNGLQRVFSGHIVGIAPSFPSSGPVTLTVAAQDDRSRLQQATHTRWFALRAGNRQLPLPDLAVVAQIVGMHQLLPIIDPLDAVSSVLLSGADMALGVVTGSLNLQKLIRKQANEDDLSFLKKICAENGWEMAVDHAGPRGGHALRFFSPATHTAPDARLKWGESLLDFAPRLSSVGQVAKISVQFWVDTLKREFRASVGYDWDKSELRFQLRPIQPEAGGNAPDETPGAAQPDEKSTVQHEEELAGAGVTKDSVLKTLVATLLAKLNSQLTASITCIGDPVLQAGRVVELEAPSKRFSGRYRIVEAGHTIDGGGYRTTCSLRREIWLHAPDLRSPHPTFAF